MLDRFLWRVLYGAMFLTVVGMTVLLGVFAWRALLFMGLWN